MPTTELTMNVDEFGATDGLEKVLDVVLPESADRLFKILDKVDTRMSVQVTDAEIVIRSPLRTRRIPWDRVARIHTGSRLQKVITAALIALPLTRLRKLPLLGGVMASGLTGGARILVNGPLSRLDERVGDHVVRIETRGKDVAFSGAMSFVALMSPGLTERLVTEARARGIQIVDNPGRSL